MWTLMVEGGYPMWFLLLFGIAALFSAAAFAFRPDHQRRRLAVGFGATTLFSTLTGTASDIAAVGHGAPAYLASHPGQTWTEVVLTGLAESMSPAIVGFSMLAVVALLLSVGIFRAESPDMTEA